MPDRVVVRAPATIANLGPGFDCLGVAVSWHNEVRVERDPSGGLSVTAAGHGADAVPRDASNLVVRTIAGVLGSGDGLRLHQTNAIPFGRGFGSSAAAIVAGLTLANRWLRNRYTRKELLAEAIAIEGHPDNVSASLYGGLTLSFPRTGGTVEALRLKPPAGIGITLVIPEIRVSTEKARALLPKSVPLASAAANTARAMALLQALERRRFDLLADALHDVYHVPHRARLIPAYARVVEAGLRAGAAGVTISGSGPTLLAFHAPGLGERVGAAMTRAFMRARVRARAIPGRIDRRGARARVHR